jgi:hypothetical protein
MMENNNTTRRKKREMIAQIETVKSLSEERFADLKKRTIIQ